MKYLFTTLILFLSFGCSTTAPNVICSIEQTAVTGISTAIGIQLQCSNVVAIKKDLDHVIAQVGICKQSPTFNAQGKLTLPAPLCSILQGLIVNEVAPAIIPPAWGCSAQNAKAVLGQVVMMACQAL